MYCCSVLGVTAGYHRRMARTPTPVNFTLDLPEWNGSRTSQVACALIGAVASGRLHDGDRLPSTRTLAATFGLARSAVVGAYEELTAAGFLVAHPGGSTYVEHGAVEAARAGAFGAAAPNTRPGQPAAAARRAPRQQDPLRPPSRPGRPGADLRAGLDPGHAAGHRTGPGARGRHRPAARPSGPPLAGTCAGSSAATCAGPAGWPRTRKTSSCSPASPARCARSLSPAG